MPSNRVDIDKVAMTIALVDFGSHAVGPGGIQIEPAVLVEVDKLRAVAFAHVLRAVRSGYVGEAERLGSARFDQIVFVVGFGSGRARIAETRRHVDIEIPVTIGVTNAHSIRPARDRTGNSVRGWQCREVM